MELRTFGTKQRLSNTIGRLERLPEPLRTQIEAVRALSISKGNEPITTEKNVSKAIRVAKRLGITDFSKLSKAEVIAFSNEIIALRQKGKIKESTRKDYATSLCLALQVVDNPHHEEVNTQLKGREVQEVTRDDLPTIEEADDMVRNAGSTRNEALLAIFRESGGRTGEILGLRIKDIVDRGDEIDLRVKGKKGFRVIPSQIDSVPRVRRWLASHPLRANPDAPLWVIRKVKKEDDGEKEITFEPLGAYACYRILGRACDKISYTKKMTLRYFRKLRATELSTILTPHEMNAFFGWSPGSSTSGYYVRLSSQDVSKKLRQRQHGKVVVEPQYRVCESCGHNNEQKARFCIRCSFALDDETKLNKIKQRQQWELLQDKILENPQLVEALLSTMHRLTLEAKK